MNKKIETRCPKDTCNNNGPHTVLYENDGSDNVDKKSHYHVECKNCGQQFNLWGYEKFYRLIEEKPEQGNETPSGKGLMVESNSPSS